MKDALKYWAWMFAVGAVLYYAVLLAGKLFGL